MINNPSLSLLLANNGIKESVLEEKLYHTLILGVFEVLCKDLSKKNLCVEAKESFRKSPDKVFFAKNLVSKHVGCKLSDSECKIIVEYLKAFFSKENSRKSFDTNYKESILKRQKYRCIICEKEIDLSNSHLDHIIPFAYVGDVLSDNYQMLCETCNTRKGTAAYFELSMLLLKRNSNSS